MAWWKNNRSDLGCLLNIGHNNGAFRNAATGSIILMRLQTVPTMVMIGTVQSTNRTAFLPRHTVMDDMETS
jgi:hypothetical protein